MGKSPFQISVKSFDQKGGQTAFIINNNYRDPDYVPDSLNFLVKYTNPSKTILSIEPRYGAWPDLFIIYPDTSSSVDDMINGAVFGSCENASMIDLKIRKGIGYYKKRKVQVSIQTIQSSSCKKEIPYCVQPPDTKSFFIFGDCAQCKDRNRWYVYDNGVVYWYKHSKDVIFP